MSEAQHTHSHAHLDGHGGRGGQRKRPGLRASWLRHSALQRLAMAGGAIALLWAAVYWALQ